MSGPVTTTHYDAAIEEHGMRQHGMLGRGGGMGNSLFSIDYDRLPPEARTTITLIISDGPFPYPGKDGSYFGNSFGDLPSGRYLEYTVPTPGASNRGARRIVARCTTAQLFFTACHYERVHVQGGTKAERDQARIATTSTIDAEWKNGFYIITGMSLDLRNAISIAIKAKG
jgi:guanyl-specific ribonuclease Sa